MRIVIITGAVVVVCLCLVVIGMIVWNNVLRQTLARCEMSNVILQQKTQPLSEWKFGVRGSAFEQQDPSTTKVIKGMNGYVEGNCVKKGKLSQCVVNFDPTKVKEEKVQKTVRFDGLAEARPFEQQAQPQQMLSFASNASTAPMAVQFGISSENPAKSETGQKEKHVHTSSGPAVAANGLHMKSSNRNIDSIKSTKRVLDDANDSEFKWANDTE